MEKDPTDYNLITYVWISIVSIAGIFVNFLEVNRHCMSWSKTPDLLIDATIAPILGIFMFYLCDSVGMPTVMTAGLIGLFSTFGTRGMYILRRNLIERIIQQRGNHEHDLD